MSSNKWLFFANDGLNGLELWVTDGKDAGTKLLKDIYPGFTSSMMTNLLDLGNGKMVFTGNNGINGPELWVTDGTTAGTLQLKNIEIGDPYGSTPTNFFSLGNGKALFTAVISRLSKNGELWVTDGTAAGTTLVKDIYSGTTGFTPSDFTAISSGKVVFTANDHNQGYEMWISDGTSAGTKVLEQFGFNNGGGGATQLTSLGNGKIVFSSYDSVNGRELWVTDGTASGTNLLKNIAAGTANSIFQANFTVLANGKAVFAANDSIRGTELWVTNGTAAGTSLLKDINVGSSGSIVANFHVLSNGKALFAANDGKNADFLWITDGTTAGTHLVKDVKAVYDNYMTLNNGKVLFTGVYGGRSGLWITDGTTSGTKAIIDNLGVGDASGQAHFTALGNGKVVFVADGGWPYGRELWITDGTAAGTKMLKDITTGFGNSSILGNFSSLGNGLVTFASGFSLDQLWVTNGTEAGTVLLEDYSADFGKLSLLQGSDRTGTAGNDTLVGDARANQMFGLAGNDSLDGGAGNDTMSGGTGNDTYYVRQTGDVVIEAINAGIDTVYSYLTAYTLTDNVENGRVMTTNAANLTCNALNNTLFAGSGNNVLNGGNGVDTVSYIYGVSATTGVTVSLAISTAQATGGSGSDTLASIENLTGSAYADKMTGNNGGNILNGGAGNDTINGGSGNDTIIGDVGKDSLTGGTGNDIFDFNKLTDTGITNTTWDVITDFTKGQDKIDLFALDANSATANNDAFSSIIGSAVAFSSAGQLKVASNVLYGNTDTDSAAEFAIQLTGISSLSLTDFVL